MFFYFPYPCLITRCLIYKPLANIMWMWSIDEGDTGRKTYLWHNLSHLECCGFRQGLNDALQGCWKTFFFLHWIVRVSPKKSPCCTTTSRFDRIHHREPSWVLQHLFANTRIWTANTCKVLSHLLNGSNLVQIPIFRCSLLVCKIPFCSQQLNSWDELSSLTIAMCRDPLSVVASVWHRDVSCQIKIWIGDSRILKRWSIMLHSL